MTAIEAATCASRQVVPSGAGEFAFHDLPAGIYTVTAEASGSPSSEIQRCTLILETRLMRDPEPYHDVSVLRHRSNWAAWSKAQL